MLVIIGAIGFGVYYLFFRSTTSPLGNGGGGGFNTGGDDVGGVAPPDVGVPVEGAGDEVAPRLFKITDGPVAEGVIALTIQVVDERLGTSSTRADTEVRFADRASGNLYRYVLGERTLERMTNRTLPGIQEAVWAKDGSRAFLRYLATDGAGERIETYALPIDGTEGYVLESGLSSVVAGTSTVLTVLPSSTGSIGTRASLAGANQSTLFTTSLSSLRFLAAGASYAAVTRGSASLSGYAFSLPANGILTRILGPLAGLSVLPSPSGARFLYSSLAGGGFEMAVLEVSPANTTALPLSTLAEKCAWAVDERALYCAVPRALTGTLPDDWYQGQVSTSDRFWKIDLDSRVASMLFDPRLLAEADIDAVALTLDGEEDTLVFTNKQDGSLWLYDL